MNSIGPECQELKKAYDECFNKWFSEKFLKGKHDDNICEPMFKVYQECVKKAITEKNINLWELEKDVLDTSQEKQPPSSSK